MSFLLVFKSMFTLPTTDYIASVNQAIYQAGYRASHIL